MKEKIILSCTTFFRKDFSIQDFIENFKTLFSTDVYFKNKIESVIIINEYSEENKAQFEKNRELIHSLFPFANFIQKDEMLVGQANSLNIILHYCKDFDFHIQWEEGWICNAPFIDDVLSLFKSNGYAQIGITNDLEQFTYIVKSSVQKNPGAVEFKDLKVDNCFFEQNIIYKKGDGIGKMLAQIHQVKFKLWPLYSLQPCVNRISFIRQLEFFSTHQSLWPVRFEYIYALEWLLAGGTKSILAVSRAERSKNKKSTYAR